MDEISILDTDNINLVSKSNKNNSLTKANYQSNSNELKALKYLKSNDKSDFDLQLNISDINIKDNNSSFD